MTDRTAYRYNAELRKMVKDLKLTHIVFVRVQELLANNHATGDIVDMNEDDYLVRAPKTREEFLATDIGNWDVEEQLKTDEGTLRTYRGYLRFLKLDLEERQNLPAENETEGLSFKGLSRKAREKVIGGIAKKMMGNGAVSYHPELPLFRSQSVPFVISALLRSCWEVILHRHSSQYPPPHQRRSQVRPSHLPRR